MAFSNIENSEKLEIINIAIVENDEFNKNPIYKETFKKLSDEENEDRLFNTKYVTEEKAKEMLEKEEITGYLILKQEPQIVVKANGLNETIFKEVVEEINQTKEIMNNITSEYLKILPPHDIREHI